MWMRDRTEVRLLVRAGAMAVLAFRVVGPMRATTRFSQPNDHADRKFAPFRMLRAAAA